MIDAEAEARPSRPETSSPPRTDATRRKSAILAAACHQFGAHGFRGASLRDIAREADVSLTLLNHHFGNKSALLESLVQTRREELKACAGSAQGLVDAGDRLPNLEQILNAWTLAVFAIADRPGGQSFLRLVSRLLDDPCQEVVDIVQEHVDPMSEALIDAFQRCRPDVSRPILAAAQAWASAAMLRHLTGTRRTERLALEVTRGNGKPADRTRLLAFLTAGIEAALRVDDSQCELARPALSQPATTAVHARAAEDAWDC